MALVQIIKDKAPKILRFLMACALIIGPFFFWQQSKINQNFPTSFPPTTQEKPEVLTKWTEQFFEHKELPLNIENDGKHYIFTYTLNEDLDNFIGELLKRHHPDFGAVVVIDNETGSILSAVDFSRETKKLGRTLAFSATHPAASLIKVVTAADLLEHKKLNLDTLLKFRGKRTTLYKSQLESPEGRRWVRETNLKTAFGRSNNAIFGRLAIKHSTSKQLLQMAEKFQFNKALLEEMTGGHSQFQLATDDFELAELASGFNKTTLISPLHAALFPSIIVNGGVLKRPALIEAIYELESGKAVWTPSRIEHRVLREDVAKNMKLLLKETTGSGTARRYFRKLRPPNGIVLEVGGKTGSLTGGVPWGKRDWFAAFAAPEDKKLGRGISLAVMLVNQKKWYVKSTFVARKIIDYYYKHVFPFESYQQMATMLETKRTTTGKKRGS